MDTKEEIMSFYKTRLGQMLSDADFRRLLKNPKILEYKDFKKYGDLYEVLPNDKDYAIILTEFKPNSGHWCALTRKGNKFYWMDSYGVKYDGENKFIPQAMRKMLGEDDHDLTRLVNATRMKGGIVDYNKKKYQILKDGINTCGRWTYNFILMHELGYSPEQYREIWKKLKANNGGKPYDLLLCEMI
jgi:hypothetical protein